jgi:hypothetical protein
MNISKNKKGLILLFYVISFSTSLIGQDTLKSIIQGPYGGDMRIRPSYGIIPDAQVENCKKIIDLDSKRIAIAVKFPQVLTITNNNFWKDKSIDYKYRFNVEDFIKTLIFSSPAQSVYNFKLFESEDSKRLDLNLWNGKLKLSETALDSLINKYESDYLILIRGGKSMYFPSGIKNEGSQGLYGYGNSNVYMIYAGQIVSIYSLKTGKLLSKGSFPQESADVIPLLLKQDFKDFTTEQLNLIDKLMEERLRNNLKQSYKLLGLE